MSIKKIFKRKSKLQVLKLKVKNFNLDNILIILILPYLISTFITYIVFILNFGIFSIVILIRSGYKIWWDNFSSMLIDEWKRLFYDIFI